MYYLFTTPTCPNCPRAKTLLQDHEQVTPLELIDASTPEGLALARKYNISQVPSLIEVDQDHRALKVYSGLTNISDALVS